MIEQNWGLLKFKYEVLGISTEALSADHNIPLALLEHMSEQWKRLPLESLNEVPLEDMKSFDEIVEKLKSNTISQVQAFNLLKDRFLSSKYIELESLIVMKAVELTTSISGTDKTAADMLRTLTSVFTSMKSVQPAEDTEGFGGGSTKWEVTVVDGTGEKREG